MNRINRTIFATCLLSIVTSLILVSLLPNSVIIKTNGSTTENVKEPNLKSSYIEVSPISINGDFEFSTFNATHTSFCSGNGSNINPYVIRGIKISGSSGLNCITILNTRVNFTITECYFEDRENDKAGIFLHNVANADIINNTFSSNTYGLYLNNCSYNDINQNIFRRNDIAIKLNITTTNLSMKNNKIWKNYFIYSDLAQIQIYNINNPLDNNSCGNYWTNFRVEFDIYKNFTVEFSGKTLKLFVGKFRNNISLSPLIQDRYPLISNDSDEDGLDDIMEILYWGTLYNNADTDGDGMTDGWECANDLDPLVNDAEDDEDDDGLENLYEYETVYEHDDGSKHYTDPNDDDTDNDGWSDGDEVDEDTDPTNYFDHPRAKQADEFAITDLIDPEFLLSILPIAIVVIGAVAVIVVVVKISRRSKKTGAKPKAKKKPQPKKQPKSKKEPKSEPTSEEE